MAPDASEFLPALYEEFLEFVRAEYAGAYWHALPRDVARYFRTQEKGALTTSASPKPGPV